MKTVYFEKNGTPLTLKFKIYNGVMSSGYTIEISKGGDADPFEVHKNSDSNCIGDCFLLPESPDTYDGCMITTTVDFSGLDLSMSKNYSIGMEVYQNSVMLDSVPQNGTFSSNEDSIILLLILKAK